MARLLPYFYNINLIRQSRYCEVTNVDRPRKLRTFEEESYQSMLTDILISSLVNFLKAFATFTTFSRAFSCASFEKI